MVDAGPAGEVDSINLYAFNRFDSVNFIDPLGLAARSGGGAGVAKGACKQAGQFETVVCGKGDDKDAEKAAAEDAAAKKEALKQEQRSQQLGNGPQLGGIGVDPVLPPPGPQPPKSGVRWGKFSPNQPKPPGGFGSAAEAVAETAGHRVALRGVLRAAGAVGVAITIIEVGEVVGPPVMNVIEGQMTPEPAGTPDPDATPKSASPDHPSSEPGVPETPVVPGPTMPEVTKLPGDDQALGNPSRNPAQDKLVTEGELDDAGLDAHEIKSDIVGKKNISKFDIYKDKDGNLYVKPKGGDGDGEPTGIKLP